MLDDKGIGYWLFALWTYGRIEIQFQYIKTRPVYDKPEMRMRLLEKINNIPSISIPSDGIEKRPSIPIAAISDGTNLELFLRVWDEYIHEIRKDA